MALSQEMAEHKRRGRNQKTRITNCSPLNSQGVHCDIKTLRGNLERTLGERVWNSNSSIIRREIPNWQHGPAPVILQMSEVPACVYTYNMHIIPLSMPLSLWIGAHYVATAGLELSMDTRLASNMETVDLCTPSNRMKGMCHHV